MIAPYALILRAPGTNCDRDVQQALDSVGARTKLVHIRELRRTPELLQRHQLLVLPGGFSYGDDAGAGKILAVELQHFLADALREFRSAEKLVLGICNGFQTLLKAGLLLPPDEDGPVMTLTDNLQGRYEDRWIHLEVAPNKCPFLKDMTRMFVPVAHGEGNFRVRKDWILDGLHQSGQVVLRYVDPEGNPAADFPHNPNGSQGGVAGLCDPSGRVLGLMPHPERHIVGTQHPRWTREGLKAEGDGLQLFRNAVEYFGS